MKKISLTFLFLSLSFGANAQNFLEASAVNDPTFSDESIENALTNEVLSTATSKPAADVTEPLQLPGGTLATSEIVVPKFFLKESEASLTERLTDQLEEKNLVISNLNFKREGGNKSFTLEQVKKVVIKSKFSIENMDIDEENSSFTARLKPQTGKYKIEVSGKYDINQKVPVLSRNLGKDEKITQDDIELKSMAVSQISSEGITDINELIGKTTTKSLSKGRMFTRDDYKNPVTIAKNSTVSALYKTESMEIKALAVALEDGSTGDIIRLKNFDSGKVFKAVVQEDGTVLIGTSSQNITASLPEGEIENNLN